MTLRVKICGLRTVEHACAAADAGADYVGLMFAPSKRQVTVAQAAPIAAALHAHAPHVQIVGVFVNTAPPAILEIAAALGLHAVQLSGEEPISDLEPLRNQRALRIVKTVRLHGSAAEQPWLLTAPEQVRLLVDAHQPGSYGGSGIVGDWNAAADLAARRPVLLAGGLTPANVAAAVGAVNPWGVDVSSGVETDGSKDPAQIRRFIAVARAEAVVF